MATRENEKTDNEGINMKNMLQNRALTILCAGTLLLAASTGLQAGDWGSGKKGQDAGQKTQDAMRKAYESSKTCVKEFKEGYRTSERGKSTCQATGAGTRKTANEAAGFIKGVFGKH